MATDWCEWLLTGCRASCCAEGKKASEHVTLQWSSELKAPSDRRPAPRSTLNVRPSSAWLLDEASCLLCGNVRRFCSLCQTKPNQHAEGHRFTGGKEGLRILGNGAQQSPEQWRLFKKHMQFDLFNKMSVTWLWNICFYQSILRELAGRSVFTFHTRCFGHNALPPLRLWSAGLFKSGGRVCSVRLLKGNTNPKLGAFLKPTCFVLLHTWTPLAPLSQFTL